MTMRYPLLAALLAMLLVASPVWAQDDAPRPLSPAELLDNLDFEQRLGAQVPHEAMFVDEAGRTVRLGDYFGRKRPVVLALVYFECPMLCTQVLNGLIDGIDNLAFNPGSEYDIVLISISPTETPDLAAEKKLNYLEMFGRPSTIDGWHFLTGEKEAIDAVADAVGYRYRYNPGTGEYAHPSGIMVLTPRGEVSRYFYGITYSTRDMRLALVEAAEEKIGSPVDKLLLFCFTYDPATGKYSLAILNVVRAGGVTTLLALVGFIGVSLSRERRRRKQQSSVMNQPPLS